MTTHAPSKPWRLDFILLAAIWGSSFLFTRLGTVEFGALPTAGVRVAIASLFLLPLLLWRGLGPLLTRHWRLLRWIGRKPGEPQPRRRIYPELPDGQTYP